MNLPDKCPFCSDPKSKTDEDGDYHYRCGSWASMQQGSFRSHRCKDAELARLAARVAELDARCKRMDELGSKLEEEKEAHAWEISPAMAQAKIDELNARVAELEAEAKQAREDELWAKENLAYVSLSDDGCWAGMYDRDASEERGLVERVDTIADALSALRDMVEGGAR